MKVDILGTEYQIEETNEKLDYRMVGRDGYCDTSIRYCAIDDMKNVEEEEDVKYDLEQYKKSVKRHELIHAFLYESGLDSCCYWAKEEAMVDWLAIQFPKMIEAFKKADAL